MFFHSLSLDPLINLRGFFYALENFFCVFCRAYCFLTYVCSVKQLKLKKMKTLENKIETRLRRLNECMSKENKVSLTGDLKLIFSADIILLEGDFTIEGQIKAREKAICYCKESKNYSLIKIHEEEIKKLRGLI